VPIYLLRALTNTDCFSHSLLSAISGDFLAHNFLATELCSAVIILPVVINFTNKSLMGTLERVTHTTLRGAANEFRGGFGRKRNQMQCAMHGSVFVSASRHIFYRDSAN